MDTTHFVEVIPEDMQTLGTEEIIPPVSQSVVSSSSIINMNTLVYSQGPDGIIMEGDEMGPEIVGEIVTDDSQELVKAIPPNQIIHMDLARNKHQESTLDCETELVVTGMVDGESDGQPGYIAMKPQSVGEVVLGNTHVGQIILQEASEMVVEQSIEVGPGSEATHGEIILVPNSMIKQEDIIEGGEVVVGSTIGNEIIIEDHVGGTMNNSRFFVGSSAEVESDQIEDVNFEDNRLVIDTNRIKLEDSIQLGYDCHECGAVLKSRASFKKHIRMHHGKEKPRKIKRAAYTVEETISGTHLYSCPSCSYTSQRRDKLDKHIMKHVLQEGFHPCGKKRHKPEAPPQRHRHNAEEYRCPLCPYSCTVYKALKKHQKAHAIGNKPVMPIKLSCKICGKDRSTEADMQKHMKKHRNGENFICDICGFASIQLKKIIQHRRMHTGEKPHLCPHCSYRSARRDNLRSHVRRMHKKENMYIDTFNPNEELIFE